MPCILWGTLYDIKMKFDLDKALAVLERTPEVLNVLLKELPEDWTMVNEGGNSWSPFDVLGHLIHGEQTDWIVRTEIILSSGPKRFTPFDRHAQFKSSGGKNLLELLLEFKQLRKTNLNILRSKKISEEDLEKTGEHPDLGEVSLKQLLSAWVVHDLGHITQVARVMAKQYKTEVGPWSKYLTVLNVTPRESTQ